MTSDEDLSIDRITRLAISEVAEAIRQKVTRDLSSDEFGAIRAIINTEHFWARAEEMRMFVQHKDPKDVLRMLTAIGERYREGGDAAFVPATPPAPSDRYCGICDGTGKCYCLRKGPGTAVGCRRCGGNAKCRHCRGSGTV
jgi:hypothetical protein